MPVQVAYYSKTKHSRRLAEAVAAALGVPAVDVREWQSAPGTEVLFLVSGLYAGRSAPEVLDFARRLKPEDAGRVILISSSASGLEQKDDLRRALAQAGMRVDPEGFVCPGSFLLVRMGRPNPRDVANAVAFAKKAVQAE